MSTPTVPHTLAEVNARTARLIGTRGIPNTWWPLSTGNDCVAFQLYTLGVRSRSQLATRLISIAAFRAWSNWDEPGAGEIRPGDLLAENWSKGHAPEHLERCYSIDRSRGTITIVSANTGPEPGEANPRGAWRKTRDLAGDWLLFGIRPPYRTVAAATSSSRKADVRKIAAYLNGQLDGADSRAARDGIPGEVYWTLVQRWGRAHSLYGAAYAIDGVPGPRTYLVERQALKAART